MLKRTSLSILIPLVFSFAAKAQADPTYMVGISFTFGSNDIGLTAKVLSDDEEETAVAAAGVSFYPMAEKNGVLILVRVISRMISRPLSAGTFCRRRLLLA